MKKTLDIVAIVSYILVIFAAVTYFPLRTYAPYVMALGAAGLLVTHFAERYNGKNLRLMRINKLRHLVGIIYGAAAYFMFGKGSYWLPALMIAAGLEIYTMHVLGKDKE